MSENHFPFRSAFDLATSIREKMISPVEVVTACLEKIQQLDGKLNSFIRLSAAEALAAAQDAESKINRGQELGPLHGVPFAVKDLIDTAGIETTAGTKVWQGFVPAEDAPVVARLRQAGAILLGKLNLHEFAFGITSRNPHYGPTLNPWDPSRMCGGSSSGSAAALAAGFVPITLGTDTGGSIRIPSSLCGVLGLKPTYGLVSRRGVFPLAWSLDHVGPMAGDARDLALALTVIAGHDPGDPTTVRLGKQDYLAAMNIDPRTVRVGLPKSFFFDEVRADVKEAVLTAASNLEGLGCKVDYLEIPRITEADLAAYTVLFAEAAASLEKHVREQPEAIGEEVMANLQLGMTIPATRYIQALRVRRQLLLDLAETFRRVDVLLAPTCTIDAPPIDSQTVSLGPGKTVSIRTALTRFTRYFNLAGNPVLNLPCGLSANGLPVGCQLVAAPFAEATILGLAHAYLQAHPLPAAPAP